MTKEQQMDIEDIVKNKWYLHTQDSQGAFVTCGNEVIEFIESLLADKDKEIEKYKLRDNSTSKICAILDKEQQENKALQERVTKLEGLMASDEDIASIEFIHDRLLEVHGENVNYDYMIRVRKTVDKLYKQALSTKTGEECHDVDVLEKYGKTHHVLKRMGTEVVLGHLNDNQSVCAGDGKTYHYLLTKKCNGTGKSKGE